MHSTFLKSLVRDLITESRIDDVEEKYPDLDTDSLIALDPSKNHKYLMWIATQVANGEDSNSIGDLVSFFDKNLRLFKNKDLNSYKTASELEEAEEKIRQQGLQSKTQQKRQARAEGSDVIFSDGPFFLVHVKSTEASCFYGAGTKWCISAREENMFNEYSSKNVIFYFLIDREADQHSRFSKLAFSVERDMQNRIRNIKLFDATDKEINTRTAQNKMGAVFKKALTIVKQLAPMAPKSVLARFKASEEMSDNELLKLAQDEDANVRYAVAQNPNISSETLGILAQDEKASVRIKVTQNPNTSLKILKLLAQDEDANVRYAVAVNPNTSSETLDILAQDEKASVRHGVAKNPNISSETLDLLAQDEDTNIRYEIAANPNTSPKILRLLAQDEKAFIRIEVTQNPNTSPKILRLLAQDEDEYIRGEVAANPNTSTEALDLLTQDEDEYVRAAAEKNLRMQK